MAADDTAGALRRLGCNHDGQHLVVVRKRRHVFVPLCRQLQLLLRNRVTCDTSAIAQATGSGLCAEEPAIAVAEPAMARLIVEPLKGVEPLQLARAYKVQYTRSVMATRQAKLCRLCSDRRRRKMAKIGKSGRAGPKLILGLLPAPAARISRLKEGCAFACANATE